MRHMKAGRKLSRRKDHRVSMLANLACSLVKNGSVRTTDAKAKEVRPIVERMVTFAKRGDLHARRIVLSRLRDTVAVKKLFDEYGPKYADRLGGYTRILKLGFRSGDNSPISLVEFVGNEKAVKKTAHKAKTPVKRAARRKAGAGEPETVETPAAKESAKAEPVEEKAE